MTTTATTSNALSDNTLVTVAEAARLCGYQVPIFYQERFQTSHNLVKPTDGGTWHISLGELRRGGLLTSDYKPTRRNGMGRVVSTHMYSELKTEVTTLQEANARLTQENALLQRQLEQALWIVAEKDKINANYQTIIEMLQSK